MDTKVLLHLPRATFVYCFIFIGAFLSKHVYWDRLVLSLIAFFGILQLTSYSLDELKGRHCCTNISDKELKIRAVVGVIIASGIGVYLSYMYSWYIMAFAIFGLITAVFYNYELVGGKMHSSLWLGVSWGSATLLGSYYLHSISLSIGVVIISLFACVIGIFHVRSYGTRKCRSSGSCKEYKSGLHDRLCHGLTCSKRLEMDKEIHKLSGKLINYQVLMIVVLTIAVIALHFG